MNIVVMADKAIMPTDARTPSLFHIAIEPVEVFDYRSRDKFIAACKSAVSRGIPEVEMPSDVTYDEKGILLREPIELKYSNCKSVEELESKSVLIAIECYDQGFLVESWGRSKDGKWSDEKVLELRLSPEVEIAGVVDAILEHLKTRKDLG